MKKLGIKVFLKIFQKKKELEILGINNPTKFIKTFEKI